jgi:hypothetical protein
MLQAGGPPPGPQQGLLNDVIRKVTVAAQPDHVTPERRGVLVVQGAKQFCLRVGHVHTSTLNDDTATKKVHHE